MKRVLCPQLPKPGHSTALPEQEAEHVVKVLRLRDGDTIEALDGQGRAALVTLRTKGGPVRIEHLESAAHVQGGQAGMPVPVILEMGILKGDAMEWAIEKAVELGVKRFIPVLTGHTVVQLKNKGPEAFQQRWQKIADQALKQCGRLEKMEVAAPIDLEDLLSREPATPLTPRLWCDEGGKDEVPYLLNWLNERKARGADSFAQPIRVLIGPEGGWSTTERDGLLREDSVIRVGLGPLILRAETAALFCSSLLSAFFRISSGKEPS